MPALQELSEPDLRAALDQALERVGAAEREAALQNAAAEQAEAQAKAHSQARQRHDTQAKAIQAACRQMQVANRDLEEESARLSEDIMARRLELQQKMESAIGDVQKSAEAEAVEQAKIVEENRKSAEQLLKFGAQRDAAARHREAEAHAKDLEERLYKARLAEAEARLTDMLHQSGALGARTQVLQEREAGQREQLRLCEKQWAELQATLDQTAATLGQYETQAREATAKAAALNEEKARLEAKIAGFPAKKAAAHARLAALREQIEAEPAALERMRDEARELQALVKESLRFTLKFI